MTGKVGEVKTDKQRKSDIGGEYFDCGGQRHITRNYRIKKQKDIATLQSSNKFEVLRSRVMNKREKSERVERRKIENKINLVIVLLY